MKTVLPEVLIGSIFTKQHSVEIENAKFHKAFYLLKKGGKFNKFLKEIKFSGSPANPYSEALDEGLFNLQFSGALSRDNPKLIKYSKTKGFESKFDYFSTGIVPKDLKQIEGLASEVLKKYDSL